MKMPLILHLAVALLHNDAGEVLLVRKDYSKHYMLAGGKIETHESPIAALTRELYEELSISVPAYLPHFVGQFSAPAVNEKGYTVQAHLYTLYWPGPIQVGAEIKQAHWFSPDETKELRLAPLARRVVHANFIHTY